MCSWRAGRRRNRRAIAGLRRFRSVEELAFVEPTELATIEGFDADTAAEIQARAQAILARIEAEFDERRNGLGVADDLKSIEGVTTPMLVKLGENDVKSVEDLAGCATDDLVGLDGSPAWAKTRFTPDSSTVSTFPANRPTR